ncbi:TetR/AcrR family transcriptional regulator [Bailinhaonella thermotolerans]|nr:TetR family transcriptional regulator [Bailinhaonella thermotolerans]
MATAAPGLRERKKRRTRIALIDAALDLFLAHGYEATTIDQIVAAVEVSQRTFFRYFSNKEEVALSVPIEVEQNFLRAVRERPVHEAPFDVLVGAVRGAMRSIEGEGPEERERFLKSHELIERTPVLLAGNVRRSMETEKLIVAEIARRRGLDPAADRRPHMIVSLFMGVLRGTVDFCFGPDAHLGGPPTLQSLATALEEGIAFARASLRPGWDRI